MANNNMTAFDIVMSRAGRKTTGAKNTAREDIQKAIPSAQEFQTAMLSTLSQPARATDGPAQVQTPSAPQPQAIQTPELDSFRGNATGNTWEDTNALARQLDAEKAEREAQVRRITDDWSGDAAMYLQSGGEVDANTVRGLDNIQRRYLGDMAGGVRNVINEAGYLAQGSMGGMQNDPTLSGDAALYMQTFGDNIPEVKDLKRITDFGQNFQNETQQLYGDMTGGWKVAGDLAGTVGQMTPAMALNLVPGAGAALSSAYLFGSAAGGATEGAAARGADAYTAMQYGVASGAVELATEKLFDGLGGLLGKGAADDIVEGVIGRLTRGSGSNALRNALRLGFGALGEGAEEGISAALNPLLNTIYNNKTVRESYKDLDWNDLAYQVMLGALSGGVLGSLGMVNGQFHGKNAELTARATAEIVNDYLTNTPEGQAVAERADNSPVGENAAQTPAPNDNRLFHTPVNRSGANQILFDPAQRAAFEQETGVSLSNMSIRDAANLIMEYSRQSAETGQTGFDVAYPIKTPPAPQQFNRPLSRSEAMQVVNDPTLRALFEQETGRKIPGKKFAVEFVQNVTAQLAEQAQAPAQPSSPIAQAVLNNEQQTAQAQPEAPAQQAAPVQTQAEAQLAAEQQAPQPAQPLSAQTGFPPITPRKTPKGTTVARVRPAPKRAEGTKLSQGVKTVQNARVTTDEMNAIITKSAEDGGFHYFPITNDQTMTNAVERIQRDGWTKARADWTADARSGKVSAEMMAVGALLYNNAVSAGDTRAAADIMRDYIACGTNAAQALQARKMLANMLPETRLYMLERTVDDMLQRMGDAAPEGVEISDELREQYLNAQDEAARDAVIDDIITDLAKQMPVTFTANGKVSWKNVLRKWTALRYMNMLGNFKTQVRNLAGNAVNAALYTAKNEVQAAVEGLAYVASGGKYERHTSAIVTDRDLIRAAGRYFDANEDVISGEGRYSDNLSKDAITRDIEKRQRVFTLPVIGRVMEAGRRATNWATEKGDTIFIKPRFARTLAGYLQANGIDAATFAGIQDGSIKPTEEQRALIDRAVNYATQEAQEATFHDHNVISDTVARIGRGEKTWKPLKVIAEGVMPFRRTPANIAVRMEEFSPLGFVNATVKAIQAAKGKGNVTGADVINSISKATTGTGMFLLGMLLRNAGWLRGKEDDDKQETFDRMQGEQDWSLVLPDVISFTMDWLAPSSGILFTGAQFADALADGRISGKELEKVLSSITDPMVEMSMLQGINDALENIRYADSNIFEFAASSAVSYLTQGITSTLAGQLERTREDQRSETYVDTESWLPRSVQRQLGKLGEKSPFFDYHQVEYLDAWGRPQMYEDNKAVRALENFASPAYVSQNNSTEVDAELQRLYDAGMGNVFPQRISMSDKINVYDEHGQKTGERQLTADEYVQVQREAGQAKLQMVKDLMAMPMYDAMSDEARADAIANIYQYANYQAIRGVEPSHEDKYSEIAALSNPVAYFATKDAFSDAAGNRWSRDYDELNGIMENWSTLAPDVQKMLGEKVDNFSKVLNAYEGGVSVENWYKAYDAKSDLEPYGDNKEVAAWQKYQAMANVSTDKDMDIMLRGYMQDSAYESYMTARNDGLSAKDWADARAAAGMLEPPEGKENVPAALQYQAYASVLDDKGMDAMMHATLEDGSYQKYVTAREAGISAENWANAMASTVGLAPLEGHKDVTDAQMWQAMAGTVSDKDMDALMRANLSEGQLQNYNDVRNAGISAQLWADTRAAVEQLPVLDGRSKVADFQAAYYIGSDSSLSNKEKDALMGLYLEKGKDGKMSTYEKYMACRSAGFAPQHLAKFLEFRSTAGKKDDVIAAAMRYGFTEKNALALWNMFQSGHW